MTKLLEQVFQKASALPAKQQDALAKFLLAEIADEGIPACGREVVHLCGYSGIWEDRIPARRERAAVTWADVLSTHPNLPAFTIPDPRYSRHSRFPRNYSSSPASDRADCSVQQDCMQCPGVGRCIGGYPSR